MTETNKLSLGLSHCCPQRFHSHQSIEIQSLERNASSCNFLCVWAETWLWSSQLPVDGGWASSSNRLQSGTLTPTPRHYVHTHSYPRWVKLSEQKLSCGPFALESLCIWSLMPLLCFRSKPTFQWADQLNICPYSKPLHARNSDNIWRTVTKHTFLCKNEVKV